MESRPPGATHPGGPSAALGNRLDKDESDHLMQPRQSQVQRQHSTLAFLPEASAGRNSANAEPQRRKLTTVIFPSLSASPTTHAETIPLHSLSDALLQKALPTPSSCSRILLFLLFKFSFFLFEEIVHILMPDKI